MKCRGKASCCCCSRNLPLQESRAGLPQRAGLPLLLPVQGNQEVSLSELANPPSDTEVIRHLCSMTYRFGRGGKRCRILSHTPQAQDLAHSALFLLISFLILPFIDGDNFGSFSFGPESRLFRGTGCKHPLNSGSCFHPATSFGEVNI